MSCNFRSLSNLEWIKLTNTLKRLLYDELEEWEKAAMVFSFSGEKVSLLGDAISLEVSLKVERYPTVASVAKLHRAALDFAERLACELGGELMSHAEVSTGGWGDEKDRVWHTLTMSLYTPT